MSEIRKVPASAGVQWLLGSIGLFGKAPLQLAMLAVTFGLLITSATFIALLSPMVGSLVQLVAMLATPVLMGGLIFAVREVSQGRPATTGALFEGFQRGRLPHLLVAVLPYFLASLLLGALFYVLMGSDGLQRWQEVQTQVNAISQSGGTLEPAQAEQLAASLPVFRFLLWVLITTLSNIAIGLMLAFMLPQVMFSGVHGWQAMINSLRASLVNFAAMSVFYVSVLIGMFLLSVASAILMVICGLLLGPQIALLLSMVFMMATALPVISGAVYLGWKQILAPADGNADAAPRQEPGHVFEA
ncbi:MAG: BPSS1780 family membrane protein [Stenotrophomonas sp.]|uniref:BPSS1780 family membrane protein n=1 Tax=Stenotrophomonas sp. TaxID=69392 RepID=UPI0028AD4E36|nr:BPSS1780 family membrane protein [Stenotrophomonas sp.]